MRRDVELRNRTYGASARAPYEHQPTLAGVIRDRFSAFIGEENSMSIDETNTRIYNTATNLQENSRESKRWKDIARLAIYATLCMW